MLDKYKIVKCPVHDNYSLNITFADSKTGFVNLKYLVGSGIFKKWKDYNEFKKVAIDPITKTICWDGMIDLDPITLRKNLN
ncbi:MAG: DUF2442 domain-containing protein [Rickettsiales bacterium]|nr:DUF2442 domain-containing protein [Rickettsiales bacterium]